jgi:predicted nucleotidyltransferase
MNNYIRKQIFDIIKKWKDNLKTEFKIIKVEAKGSLLTKRYTEDSDLDVSIYTDLTRAQADKLWDIIPKGTMIISKGKETKHPIDFFIVAKGEKIPEQNVDAIFSLTDNKFVKKPKEYKNEIPFNYLLNVANFYINGCSIALSNYENDKTLYNFYKNLDPKTQEITEDEKNKYLSEQLRKLTADGDALKLANHLITSFRREVYDEKDPNPFEISIKLNVNNVHVSLNEQLLKLMEKLNLRQQLKAKEKECEDFIKKEKV